MGRLEGRFDPCRALAQQDRCQHAKAHPAEHQREDQLKADHLPPQITVEDRLGGPLGIDVAAEGPARFLVLAQLAVHILGIGRVVKADSCPSVLLAAVGVRVLGRRFVVVVLASAVELQVGADDLRRRLLPVSHFEMRDDRPAQPHGDRRATAGKRQGKQDQAAELFEHRNAILATCPGAWPPATRRSRRAASRPGLRPNP